MNYSPSASSVPCAHERIDARSLALARLVAARLRERPELLQVAEENLKRWQHTAAPNVQAALREWRGVLDAGLEATVATLTGGDERSARLRQSNPFAGEEVVTREERRRLWKQFAP